jgi:hypothetical protein
VGDTAQLRAARASAERLATAYQSLDDAIAVLHRMTVEIIREIGVEELEVTDRLGGVHEDEWQVIFRNRELVAFQARLGPTAHVADAVAHCSVERAGERRVIVLVREGEALTWYVKPNPPVEPLTRETLIDLVWQALEAQLKVLRAQ